MATVDFPNSPTLNQTFNSAGLQWSWDGAKWVTGPPGSWAPIASPTFTGTITAPVYLSTVTTGAEAFGIGSNTTSGIVSTWWGLTGSGMGLTLGCYTTATQTIATNASASNLYFGEDGTMQYQVNTGLTVGSAFTPTTKLNVTPTLATFTVPVVTPVGNASTFFIGPSATTPSYSIQATSGGANIGAGVYTAGSGWIATAANASLLAMTGGAHNFYGNTGLTVGSTYGPALLLQLNPSIAAFTPPVLAEITNGQPAFCVGSATSGSGLQITLGASGLQQGVYYNGSSYLASATSSEQILMGGGNTSFYCNSGQTIGAAVTGNAVFQITPTQVNCLLTGQSISHGGTGFANTIAPGHGFTFYWNSSYVYVAVDNASGWLQVTGQSDERLKEAIAPSTFDCLDTVMKLPINQYRWKPPTNPSKSGIKVPRGDAKAAGELVPVGFVAQRLYEAFPHGVNKGDDGYDDPKDHINWSVDNTAMCAVLTGAIQQLAARVEALEKRWQQ